MEQFRYRSKARMIAIVDLVLTSMSIWLPVVFFFGAIGVTVYSDDPEVQSKTKEAIANSPELQGKLNEADVSAAMGAMAAMFWVLFVLSAIIVIIQIIAAVKLVNATQIGKDALGATKLARYWRTVTIIFTVLLVLGGLKPRNLLEALFTWGCVVLRCIGIYVVHQFIGELDQAVAVGILPTHNGQVPMTAGMAYAYIPNQERQDSAPPEYNEVVKK